MAGVVWIPIAISAGDPLVILDAERRLYAGLSRDRTYYHVIQPVTPGHELLACTCAGAGRHGSCYRIDEARAVERADHHARPDWAGPARSDLEAGVAIFDAPAGAGESVEASRG